MMNSVNPNATSPAWLREEGQDDVHLLNPAAGGGAYAPPKSSHELRVSTDEDRRMLPVHYALKFVTIALCLLMAFTAVVGLRYLEGVDAVEKVFVIAYMLFFATLLLAFEIIELRRIEALEHLFRRNFGFLYGAMGKALYIIFIAFLSFGLGDPQALTYATGTSLALFGFLEVGLYLKYPEWFEK